MSKLILPLVYEYKGSKNVNVIIESDGHGFVSVSNEYSEVMFEGFSNELGKFLDDVCHGTYS